MRVEIRAGGAPAVAPRRVRRHRHSRHRPQHRLDQDADPREGVRRTASGLAASRKSVEDLLREEIEPLFDPYKPDIFEDMPPAVTRQVIAALDSDRPRRRYYVTKLIRRPPRARRQPRRRQPGSRASAAPVSFARISAAKSRSMRCCTRPPCGLGGRRELDKIYMNNNNYTPAHNAPTHDRRPEQRRLEGGGHRVGWYASLGRAQLVRAEEEARHAHLPLWCARCACHLLDPLTLSSPGAESGCGRRRHARPCAAQRWRRPGSRGRPRCRGFVDERAQCMSDHEPGDAEDAVLKWTLVALAVWV